MRAVDITTGVAAVLALAALGCETPLERAYGRSQQAYVERSIENPEAGQQAEGPRVDGVSAEEAMAKLRKHEAEEQPDQNSNRSMINVQIGQ